MKDQCKQCGGNHYITKMQSTRIAHNHMGENFYDYEQVQVNCPSCTTPEPIGLDKVWKDFNKVFIKDHTTPDELREKGVI